MNRRIWAINGDFIALRGGGVPRYAREVTLALDALLAERHPLAEGLELTLLAPEAPAELPLRHIAVKVLPEFRKPRLPQFWVQFQLPWHVQGGLISLCNLAPVAVGRHIVCIHDLHTFIMPESYGRGFGLAHRAILPVLGRRATWIATVSNLSRDHLIAYGVARERKIAVAYNGSDHALRWNANRSRLELGIRPYVLCLGRPQKYKNVELIWRIAPALHELGLDIYVAGDMGEQALGISGNVQPPNLRMLGRISDDDLAKALSRASCFLFPSRIEGFGLPAVEAMAWGCPVVASTAPCLPEVCGDAALFADPDDGNGWITAVRRLLSDAELRSRMVQKGRERASRFTWRTVGEIYLQLMAKTDEVSNFDHAVTDPDEKNGIRLESSGAGDGYRLGYKLD